MSITVHTRNGGRDNILTSHVGFMNGGKAASASEVKHQFDRWCSMLQLQAGELTIQGVYRWE